MLVVFKLFNFLYRYCYVLYKPLYFAYKRFSDRDKIKKITKLVSEGDTVLDIGANIGFYTRLFSQKVGCNGKVYAFEPDFQNFRHLKNSTKGLSNVECFQKAVAEKTGQVTIYYSSDLNVDHHTYDDGSKRPSVMVEGIAIDDFLKDIKVDIIKIDIQGFEFYALQGMKKTIERSDVLIFSEFSPGHLVKAGIDPFTYLHFIKSLGFELVIPDSWDDLLTYIEENSIEHYTDLIVNKKNQIP